MLKPLKLIFDDIELKHSLFALPFALMSVFVATDGAPKLSTLLLITLAMFFARSAAMSFNRLVDRDYDRRNPRAKDRPLASGAATARSYVIFTICMSIGFVLVCALIGWLAFALSAPALALVFSYSYSKRYTSLCHFHLGLALSLAPIGGWIAARSAIGVEGALLGVVAFFWLAGLDIIYSVKDHEFDKGEPGLHSIPKALGLAGALRLAALSHFMMGVALVLFGLAAGMSWLYWVGAALTMAALGYENSLVSHDDLSAVDRAFFTVNAYISVGLALFTISDRIVFA